MSYTLSDAKSALHKTLYAVTAFEILQCIHLTLVTLALTKQDAAKYALLVCLTYMLGKFCDAGIGPATPRLLKTTHHQARALFSVILQQAFIIIPLITVCFAFTSQASWHIILAIVFCACFEGFAILSRHATYTTLQGDRLMYAVTGIMALKVLTLIPLFLIKAITMEVLFFHFVFFLLLNATVTALLAWNHVMQDSRPFNKLYLVPMHKTVLKLRLQTFSTQISREFLTVYALTPLYTYFNGTEHTWLFFILASGITSFYTIIKASIGYTAGGAFAKLPEATHPVALHRLNRYLILLSCCAMAIAATVYVAAPFFYPLSEHARTALFYALCFGMVTFADLVPLVYEQFFLVSGHYSTFQRLRIMEYACLALLASVFLRLQGSIIATIILLCCKAGVFLAIRMKAKALIKNIATTITHPTYTPGYMTIGKDGSRTQVGNTVKHDYW